MTDGRMTRDSGAWVKRWPLYVLLPAVIVGTSSVAWVMATMALPIPTSDTAWRRMVAWLLANIIAAGLVVCLAVIAESRKPDEREASE